MDSLVGCKKKEDFLALFLSWEMVTGKWSYKTPTLWTEQKKQEQMVQKHQRNLVNSQSSSSHRPFQLLQIQPPSPSRWGWKISDWEFVYPELLPRVPLVLEGSIQGPVQCIRTAVTYLCKREAGDIPFFPKLFLGSLHQLSVLGNTFSSFCIFLWSALSFVKYQCMLFIMRSTTFVHSREFATKSQQ